MINIRKNVFETNSSSSHSITIPYPLELNENEMEINEDGYIEVSLSQFCHWEHDSQMDRLAWLIQLISNEKLGNNPFWHHYNAEEWHELADKLYATNEFKKLNAEIADYANCRGVVLSELTSGYIDHDSNYDSMEIFLSEYGVDAVDFVFGKDIEMMFEFNG